MKPGTHIRSRLVNNWMSKLALAGTMALANIRIWAAEFNVQDGVVAESGYEVAAGLDVSNLFQMLMALLIVLVFIVGLSMLLKKLNIVSNRGSKLISVVAGVPLSGRDRLLLIQVGEEQILISASPGKIEKLHSLKFPITVGATDVSEEEASESSFAKLLHSVKAGRQA